MKRYAVKWVRDKCKSHYPAKTSCEICGAMDELHFHHFNSVAELWNKWYTGPDTDTAVLSVREEFIDKFWPELTELGACLCKKHHEQLHKIYGKNPLLSTAEKQARWVEKQKVKYGL